MTRDEILKAYGKGRRDFSKANLRGIDLSFACLCWINLHEADLCEANLRWANLGHADLTGADLSGTNFYGTYLHAADLREANLHGANFENTIPDFYYDWKKWRIYEATLSLRGCPSRRG